MCERGRWGERDVARAVLLKLTIPTGKHFLQSVSLDRKRKELPQTTKPDKRNNQNEQTQTEHLLTLLHCAIYTSFVLEKLYK